MIPIAVAVIVIIVAAGISVAVVAIAAIGTIAPIAMVQRHNRTTTQRCNQGTYDQDEFHGQLLANDRQSRSSVSAAARDFAIGGAPTVAYALSYAVAPNVNPFRRAVFIILATATTGCVAAGSSGAAPLSASDMSTIRDLETRSWVAWKNHDAAFFEQFLADDHVEVHAYGITGKKAVVDGVRSPACVVQDYSIGPLSLVQVSMDTVLVTYRAEQNTACGNARVPSPVWATSLYAKRDGRWVNVLYQHTPAI